MNDENLPETTGIHRLFLSKTTKSPKWDQATHTRMALTDTFQVLLTQKKVAQHWRLSSIAFRFLALIAFFVVSSDNSFAQVDRQIKEYEKASKSAQDLLMKVVDQAKKNSRSQWHRECDNVLSALDKIDTRTPILTTLMENEKKNWSSIKSIGGELAHLNERIETRLNFCAKEVLQTARDHQEFQKKAQAHAQTAKTAFDNVITAMSDAESAAKLIKGIEAGEIPGPIDEIAERVKSTASILDKSRKTLRIGYNFVHRQFLDSEDNRKTFHREITRNVRESRRQLERLISMKMIAASDEYIDTSFEQKIEEKVEQRLQLYQKVLDDWIYESSPLMRDFNDYMHDVVGGTMQDLVKSIPTTFLGGIPLPSFTYRAGEALDLYLDRLTVAIKASETVFQKDARAKLALQRGEEQSNYRARTEAEKIRFNSIIARTKSDSLREQGSISSDISTLEQELKKITKLLEQYQVDQRQYDELVQRLKSESELGAEAKQQLTKQIDSLRRKLTDTDTSKLQLGKAQDRVIALNEELALEKSALARELQAIEQAYENDKKEWEAAHSERLKIIADAEARLK